MSKKESPRDQHLVGREVFHKLIEEHTGRRVVVELRQGDDGGVLGKCVSIFVVAVGVVWDAGTSDYFFLGESMLVPQRQKGSITHILYDLLESDLIYFL